METGKILDCSRGPAVAGNPLGIGNRDCPGSHRNCKRGMQDVARRISGINAEPFNNVRLCRCHEAPEKKRNCQLALMVSHDCSCLEYKDGWNAGTENPLWYLFADSF